MLNLLNIKVLIALTIILIVELNFTPFIGSIFSKGTAPVQLSEDVAVIPSTEVVPSIDVVPSVRVDPSTEVVPSVKVPPTVEVVPSPSDSRLLSGTCQSNTSGLNVGSASTGESLNLPITIKETAGVGVDHYPVSVVVPLPRGRYQDVSYFRLLDDCGVPIKAQFEVLNRWWGADNSLRHIKLFFNASVEAFTIPGSGIKTVFLRDDKVDINVNSSLQVEETANFITVSTGPLKFIVNKQNFSILEQVWLDSNADGFFDLSEQVLNSQAQKGGVFTGRLAGDIQIDSERNDVKVTIEESGPLRVVIKAEALTHYKNTKDHQHGFAVRIYAYADQSFVKVDYQLQNSSKDTRFSWPLYFESMNIELPINFNGEPLVTFGTGAKPFSQLRGAGLEIAQQSHDYFDIRQLGSTASIQSGTMPEGFMDVSDTEKGVTTVIRNFWQMWANGLSVDQNNNISVQLFPEWSAQWHEKKISDTGLYWLQDMQHIYKEVLFNFHDAVFTKNEMVNLAKTFQSYPVATLPTAWYQYTHATLDIGGLIPFAEKIPTKDTRQIVYPKNGFQDQYYMFNWVNFGAQEPGYRVRSCTTGGWPKSVSRFIATENPSDYFNAELFALDEINVRPQSIAGYQYDKDFSLLRLTANPYCGATWRAFEGHNKIPYDAPFLKGTGLYYDARDEQHGWHYVAEESYYFTGNLWVKDWYQFMGQFERTRLNNLDPYPDLSRRAIGHSVATALQAYRITGDKALLKLIGEYIFTYIKPHVAEETGGLFESGASFQEGFFMRAVISYMAEVETSDPQGWADAFQLLSGIMNWNYQYCNFCYYVTTLKAIDAKSDGTGTTFTDPQAWYGWVTGKQKYLDHLQLYLDGGINNGRGPFGNPSHWNGDYNGRAVQFSHNYVKQDIIPPNKIIGLSSRLEGEEIVLTWPSNSDSVRYHIVWDYKPLLAEPTIDASKTNWFAAKVIGQYPNEGMTQIARIKVPGGTVYAAVYSFDALGNLSDMSNQIVQNGPLDTHPPTAPSNVKSRVDLINASVSLVWQASTDNVAVKDYQILRNNQEIATVTTTQFVDTNLELGQMIEYTIIARDVSGNQSIAERIQVSFIDGNNALPVGAFTLPSSVVNTQALNVSARLSYDDNQVNGLHPIKNSKTQSGYDEILKYQWDIDGDGLYGLEDTPADPEGIDISVSFAGVLGKKEIALKVTDSFGAYSRTKKSLLIVSANAITVNIPISQDTVISGYNDTEKRTNFGSNSEIFTWASGVRRSLVKADVSLPLTTKLISAKLYLYIKNIEYPNKPLLSVYGMTQDWQEGANSLWGNATSGATWYEYDYFDHNTTVKNNWKYEGGDYDSVSNYGLGGNGMLDKQVIFANSWVAFDVTALVSQWVDHSAPNYGFMLLGLNPGNEVHIHSRESSKVNFRPYLEVIYD